jgi:hypothetical protein
VESLRELANRLDEAAGALTGAGRTVATAGTSYSLVGADGPGRLADTGRALSEQWLAATDARAREAATTAARLAELASTLRVVAAAYTDTDDTVRRRHAEEA